MDWSIVAIISLFMVYYFIIFIEQKRLMTEPREIITKFLTILLLYAGISLIYYSIVGRPLLTDNMQTYNAYIFIIGFIAILWTLPLILKDFKFYHKMFLAKQEKGLKLKKQRSSRNSEEKNNF